MSRPLTEPVPDPVPLHEPEQRPLLGRHPVDAASLVPGLLAVAVALVALLDLDVDAGLLLPALLLGAGLVGLVASVRRSRG